MLPSLHERYLGAARNNKKLQKAIVRDKKAREAEEKRIARDLARQAAREELAREKAECNDPGSPAL